MQSRNRTPAILEPYLQLPSERSLTLLTGTLGCTASWLTARIASQALQDQAASVLLVSWMHDEAFWRSQVKRLTNIADLALTKRFAFVDRLSESVLAPGRGTKAELEDLDSRLTRVLSGLYGNVLLILDMPDVLLATRPDLEAQQLDRLLMKLRSRVHAVVLSCIAESPRSLEEKTIHEYSGSAFIIQQAHKARLILSVRELETGSARDAAI